MYQMSERELHDLKQLILSVESNLSSDISNLKDEVRKSHEPRLKDLEQVMPTAEEAIKIKEVVESFGNWRFLLKFFTIMGGVISFFVTVSFIVVKLVKAI